MSFALLMLSGCNDKKSEPASPETPETPDTPESNVRVKSVTLSKTSCSFIELGKTLQLEATVLPADATNPKVTWTSSNAEVATVSDEGLITCKGFGDAIIIATADGKSATCTVIVIETGTITDIEGTKYKTVKIGNQWWMAENLRCNKYDTESGRSGAEIPMYTSIDTYGFSAKFDPYCVDASNKKLWGQNYATEELLQQIVKLGYLYNWAAAVGLVNESAAKGRTTPFESNRQGICPNGWHVPTVDEWDALATAMGDTKKDSGLFSYVGKKMKTTSGWYKGGNGTDDYSFAALPAGYSNFYGGYVRYVGSSAHFWTSVPYNGDEAYFKVIFDDEDIFTYGHESKATAHSIRCVMN